MGNFPSFRGRNGELVPTSSTNRGLSTLARGVYGYSLAFQLTGQSRYLEYARAGLNWINTKAKDPVYGGYYGELDLDGAPVDPLVPGTALFLPNAELLSDPSRRGQFRQDLRLMVQILIARHKNSAAGPNNRWLFWGCTDRFGTFASAQTAAGRWNERLRKLPARERRAGQRVVGT